jgi:hypothetical protein
MIALDVLYVALATIFVMIILQVLTFVATRVMYPPAPQIIYRDVHVPVQVPVLTAAYNRSCLFKFWASTGTSLPKKRTNFNPAASGSKITRV